MAKISTDISTIAPILSTKLTPNFDRSELIHEQIELNRFKDIVLKKFVYPEERELFDKLIDTRQISFVCYKRDEIGQLLFDQKLAFREPIIFKDILDRIVLPAGPDEINELIRNENTLSKEMKWKGPPILVRTEDGPLVVINGNHRLFKIVSQSDTNHPFYCMVFNTIEAYQEFSEMKLTKNIVDNGRLEWGYAVPEVKSGDRRHVLPR